MNSRDQTRRSPGLTGGKVAIITAASRGIGAACARELSLQGYRLSLLSRSEEVHELASAVGGIATRGSVSDPAALAGLVATTLQAYGRVDAIVNNTGHPAQGDLLAIDDQSWHEGLDLVFLSVARLARLVTPHFVRQRAGAIVTISSTVAQEPVPRRPVSAAMRAALATFSKIYADQYAPLGIRINTVLPGWVATHDVSADDLARIPMQRPAAAHEVARVVAFLLSEHSSYITGQSLRVDGGLLRSV